MGFERALRFAQVGVLAICICVPPILFGLGSRSAAIDNRAPTPRPAISGTKLLDTAVTDQFDDFLNDAFPFRLQAVRANARVARALGDSPSNEVVLGLDGWLFYAPAVMNSCIDTLNEGRLIDGLNRVDRLMTAVGKNITHVVAPDKASIFSNKLANESTCVLRNSEVITNLDTDAMLVAALPETRVAGAENDNAYKRTHPTLAATGHIVREQVQRNFFYDVVVNDLAAQFVVTFADKLDIVDVEVLCDKTCSVAPVTPVAQSTESDFYAIATLRDGVTEAELSVDGVPHQFDTTQPSLGVFMPASANRIVSGDLQLVDWTGRAVTPG